MHGHRFNFQESKEIGSRCFIAQAEFSSNYLYFKTQDHDLDFMTVGINNQLVAIAVYADQAPGLYFEASLFEHLTPTALFDRFARLHLPARQAPQTVVHAFREKDLPAFFIEYHRATAEAKLAPLANTVAINNLSHND